MSQIVSFEDDEAQESTSKIWAKRIAIALVVIVLVGAIGYGLKGLFAGGGAKPKGPTKIQLKDLPPPPPPPPPPPKEQPKEQPKEVPKEAPKEPEPKPVEAPPTETLKMDGPAGDGPSPFAAGTVTNENKSANTGVIGKPNGSQFSWYAGLLKSQIEDALEKDKMLSVGQYKVVMSVWLRKDGSVERVELGKSSGNSETDELIKSAVIAMPAMKESPPADMPMPVKLRVTARNMG